MADQIVPLDSSPNQAFSVSLSVDNATLTLNLSISYRELAGYWVMKIADANNNTLIGCVPLLCGVYPAANLLSQYGYMRIGSAYIINASGTSQDHPDATNLGTDFVLLWSDTAQ